MAIPVQKLPSLEEAYAGTLFGAAVTVNPDEKKVVMLDPSELIEIEDQPFHVYSPERLAELADDIKENGQINPCTIRMNDGQKIILAGRNRKKACAIAGVQVACLLVECDDATANLILVNSNLNQRQELLPSEKAFAYKLQKESYEAKGQRKSTAAVAEQNDENVKMIQRYIKLTDLSPKLLNMVDSEKLPVTVGVEFSYLKPSNMLDLSSYLCSHQEQKVSMQQAQLLREWQAETDFSLNWLDDFFDGKIKKLEPEEYKQKCSIRGGYCDNREIMKKHFCIHGNWEGCAGCCSCCRNKNSCEFVCDCCKPAPVFTQDLSTLKRFQHRDKTFFILEDKDNPGKYAAYFSIGDSIAIRLGTLQNSYDTPKQAEKALELLANSRGYTEAENTEVQKSEPTAENDLSDEDDYDTSLPFQQEQEPTEGRQAHSGNPLQTKNNLSANEPTSPLPAVPSTGETDVKFESQKNDSSVIQQSCPNKYISKEQILEMTNNQMRDKFLDSWPTWPLLVEVPEIQLTVREIVLPDCKRIISMEYSEKDISYRDCYFQLLNANEGISPINDISCTNVLEHLKNLHMEYSQKQ